MRPTTSLLKQTAGYRAPATLPVPSAAAFALVRDLLAQRPRHFREILLDGVGAKLTAANVYPAGARMKGKGKAVVEESAVEIPKEHPFVSGQYLKKHILPVLASQKLIAKEWRHAEPGSALEHAHRPHTDRKHSMWVLQDDGKSAARWSNLTSGTVTRRILSQQGHEVQLEAKAAAEAARQAKFASGEEQRSDKDVIAWDARPKGFTVTAERLHLNRRRARRREFKEEHAARKAEERVGHAQLAAEMLEKLRVAKA
ncbi:uncharacterized protein LOC62_03G004640 [Vanrija pseudolonga]|uniref:Uncharacterized protein n=1 Tax=Vanrija pseudolonga TaxID=143232 RepID=A0AAF0Y6P5_9TREE|nr:hypothetical protein LOC62_03G004640 [Vanrija pseudolonga]